MDLTERIARRCSRNSENQLIVDADSLSPAAHLPEPIGREALYEAILDAIDPIFDGALPPDGYIWGPAGAGKSAIVTALISALRSELTGQRPVFTATRGESNFSDYQFVYLDARRTGSRFKLYRGTLDAVRVETVPSRGVGTDDLREQLQSELENREGALVVVDHLGEPNTVGPDDAHRFFEPFDDLAWIGVGRTPPDELPMPIPQTHVHVPRYRYELLDILTVRGSKGLSRNLDHVHAQRLAEWADGNAHDALAALYTAAHNAERAGEPRLRSDDVAAGIDAVPTDGVPIGRVLTLSENERIVLRHLIDLPLDRDVVIDTEAEAIASESDLTSGTVKRLLYELAQDDILERVAVSVGERVVGRQPSTVRPNFSSTLFERLHDR